MKKFSSPLLHSLLRFICVLMIVFIQLPAISLGFEFTNFNYPNSNIFSTLPESNFLNQKNNSPLVVFSNTASISIADRAGAATPNGISTPYPSNIAVSGLSGTVSDVNVTISGITTARERDLNFVLVAPTGQALMILGDGGNLFGMSNINLTFDDSAATTIGTAAAITSGTYQPTDHLFSGTDSDDFPAPGPATVNSSAPEGVATLASTFNGLNPNGNWGLYIVDDSLGGGASSVSGGWSIDITVAGAVAATTTTVASNLNPALTGQTITFTSTTTQVVGGAPVNAGTVAFTNNGASIAGCSAIPVNASGQAVCMTTSPQGTRSIVATYSGTASFGTSNGSVSQQVNSPTVVTGAQFCNNGGITTPDSGVADAYPVNISVSGMVGTISKVTTQINGLTTPRPSNFDLLIVGPNAQAFVIMSDAGDAVTAVSNINLTLDDTAASALPNGTPLSGGTFRPSDYDNLNSDPFPAPAPGSFFRPSTGGVSTFASVYNGIEPNGNWAIYAVDDGAGGGTSTVSGLCVNFTLNKFSTTTSLTSSPNPSQTSQNVTFTATVTASSPLASLAPGTPTGSVEFFDGATSLGTAVLNGSGVATLMTSSLPAGMRNITAQYLGANVGAGGGGYAVSNSINLVQVVNPPVAANVSVGGRVLSTSGIGIGKAVVTMTDSNGNIYRALTNPFGYYRFDDIEVGEVYVFSVIAKGRTFATQIVTVNEDLTELNFVEQSP